MGTGCLRRSESGSEIFQCVVVGKYIGAGRLQIVVGALSLRWAENRVGVAYQTDRFTKTVAYLQRYS